MRSGIQFLFNGEAISIAELDPHTSALQWLREQRGATGSKEGCAEGDCGACTAVLGRLVDGALQLRAINTCITPLAALDGAALLSIEFLALRPESAHPLQRTLVEQHGSQCGFCTPGIVMSLFAHLEQPVARDARDCLAGNLCRCTGYAPVLAALAATDAEAARSHGQFGLAACAAELAKLPGDGYRLGDGERQWYAPDSEAALGELLSAHPQARLVAGNTDVGLLINKQRRRFNTQIWLGRLEELRRVQHRGGWLELGAGVSYSDAQQALTQWHPALGQLLRRIGSVQIRNSGTPVGNIANGSPIGDFAPAMIALGATVVLADGSGEERELRVQDYYLGPGQQARGDGEYLRALRLPPVASSARFGIHKLSKRFDQDISAVCAAFWLDLGPDNTVINARLAYGGMAAVPRRAPRAEDTLMGLPWGEQSARAAAAALAADFEPIDDWRASAAYRRSAAANLLIKFALTESGESSDLGRREVSTDD